MLENQYFLYRIVEGVSKKNEPYMKATIVVEKSYGNDELLILFIPKTKQKELKELIGCYINDHIGFLIQKDTTKDNIVIDKITYYIKSK